jgi:uncharacterized protein (DUF58 family)
MLAVVLVAMLIAGLNYNSNLGLAFAFLMASTALVAMHHCNRNLLGIEVDATSEVDAFAGGDAAFEFTLRNASSLDRRGVEIRCLTSSATTCVPARSSQTVIVAVPAPARGLLRVEQFELRTRHPFGWFNAWTYVHCVLTAHVAPAPGGSRPLPAGSGQGAASAADMRGDEEYAGLRAYEPGMPLKHMAWKVVARGVEPAVRSYTGLAAHAQWLEWRALEGWESEARLAQLCRWVLQSAAAHHVFGLRIPGAEILPGRGAAHRIACLRTLAGHGAVHR